MGLILWPSLQKDSYGFSYLRAHFPYFRHSPVPWDLRLGCGKGGWGGRHDLLITKPQDPCSTGQLSRPCTWTSWRNSSRFLIGGPDNSLKSRWYENHNLHWVLPLQSLSHGGLPLHCRFTSYLVTFTLQSLFVSYL